ncbi:MAG TPA: 30S ribosomal protein S18 [Patescibacteria group bacterium]|nr:30S ribosomal protein S18 [Patescibacteria group bacterium]
MAYINTSLHKRKQQQKQQRKHFCYFCSNNIKEIDYKNVTILQKFISNYQRILPRSRMGSCARHQRQLTQAVKRARFMGLVAYINDQK